MDVNNKNKAIITPNRTTKKIKILQQSKQKNNERTQPAIIVPSTGKDIKQAKLVPW
jgi:hypothetical protein